MRPTAICVVVLLAIAPLQVHGQSLTPAQNEELRKVKNEVFLQIAGVPRIVHGRLTDLTATDLSFITDARPYRVPMSSVGRIDTLSKRSIDKGAAIGFIAGVGMGAWCAYICGQGANGDFSATGAFFGQVGLGTLTGALSALRARGLKTIYRAEGRTESYAGPLPCPATPLVATSPIVVPDRAKWNRDTWFSDAAYHALGADRCDGVTIRRSVNMAAGAWDPGVELHFADFGDTVSVTARVTAYLPKEERDRIAVVQVEVLQGNTVLADGTVSIEVAAGKEVAGLQNVRLPRAAVANPSNLTLRITLTTTYD